MFFVFLRTLVLVLKSFQALEIAKDIEADSNLDVFPAARQQYVTQVLEKFDAAHPDHVKSLAIMGDPLSWMLKTLKSTHISPAKAKPGQPGPVKVSTVSTTDSQDRLSQDQLAPAGDGDIQLSKWLEHVASTELASYKDDASRDTFGSTTSLIMKKNIIAALNVEFAKRHVHSINEGCNLYIKAPCLDEDAGPLQSSDVFRQSEGATMLPFFGRAVDLNSATHVSRNYLLPLGDSGGNGPTLYLDGSGNVNTARSDICPAWLIKRLPLAPPPEKKSEKKASKALLSYATHEIKFEKFEFEVFDKQFSYDMPILVDIEGTPSGFKEDGTPKPLFRELIDFDKIDLPKSARPDRVQKGFVLN